MMQGPEESKDRGSDSARFPWGGELVEVSVFLFLIVPSMVLSFFVVKQGGLGFVLVVQLRQCCFQPSSFPLDMGTRDRQG